MRLTKNFTLAEATRSYIAERDGIDNAPVNIGALRVSAFGMEFVRKLLGDNPITPSSWYRSEELNDHPEVGGSKTSDHLTGYAVDFVCPKFGTPVDVVLRLKHELVYDQLILEQVGSKEWVHISFAPSLRQQTLKYKNGVYTTI